MSAGVMRWQGQANFQEIHRLTLTDPASGWGLWLRSTLRSPLHGAPTAHLWCAAAHPDGRRVTGAATLPGDAVVVDESPFCLELGDQSWLTDDGWAGQAGPVRWDLTWTTTRPTVEPVGPGLIRARMGRTRAAIGSEQRVGGTVQLDGTALALDGVPATLGHFWGDQAPATWTWAHAGELRDTDDAPAEGAFLDLWSYRATAGGRLLPGATTAVGRLLGDDFRASAVTEALRARTRGGPADWRAEVTAGARKVVAEVRAPELLGFADPSPDGRAVYCYNSAVATMRVSVLDRRIAGRAGWAQRATLSATASAQVEHGVREALPGIGLVA